MFGLGKLKVSDKQSHSNLQAKTTDVEHGSVYTGETIQGVPSSVSVEAKTTYSFVYKNDFLAGVGVGLHLFMLLTIIILVAYSLIVKKRVEKNKLALLKTLFSIYVGFTEKVGNVPDARQ